MVGLIVFDDWFELMINDLKPEQTIELLKLMYSEKKDIEYVSSDAEVNIHWRHMKFNVQTSKQIYESKTIANRANGKLGGRPPKNNKLNSNPNNPAGSSETHNNPNNLKKKDKDKDYPYHSDKDQDMGDVSSSLGDDSTPPKFKTIDEAAAYYEQQ